MLIFSLSVAFCVFIGFSWKFRLCDRVRVWKEWAMDWDFPFSRHTTFRPVIDQISGLLGRV
jgi:hypothetical protein